MIELNSYPEFQNQCTLKETSKNVSEKENVSYMTESMLEVIDFDMVKQKYASRLRLPDAPASNDALFQHQGVLYFIEFKDGNMKSEIYKVARKIYESLLLFCDITGKTISFTRENMMYILVYNKECSQKYIEERNKADQCLEKGEVQDTSSYDAIMGIVGQMAKYNVDVFGLRKRFERLYFKNVYTYNTDEFQKYMNLLQGAMKSEARQG